MVIDVGIGVSLCYLPVIMISGMHVLFSSNRWIKPMDISQIINSSPVYLAELSETVLSIHLLITKGYLITLIIGAIFITQYFKNQNNKEWFFLTIINTIFPILFILLTRVLVPYRGFTYITFIIFCTLAIVLAKPLNRITHTKIYKPLLISILTLVFIMGMYSYKL